MYLFTANEVRYDEIGPYLTVILRGFGDLCGRIRGSVDQLEAVSKDLQLMNAVVVADNAKMVCGVTPVMTIARRSVKHLDKAFQTIADAGLEVSELESMDSDEEESVDDVDYERANV